MERLLSITANEVKKKKRSIIKERAIVCSRCYDNRSRLHESRQREQFHFSIPINKQPFFCQLSKTKKLTINS
jgi:hypothetical protein